MKQLATLMLATVIAFTSISFTTSDTADARRYRRDGAIAAGIAAAVITGIIVSRAHRRHRRNYYYSDYGYYDDGYGYYDSYPAYSRRYYAPRSYRSHRRYRHHRIHRHRGYSRRDPGGVFRGLNVRHHGRHWR